MESHTHRHYRISDLVFGIILLTLLLSHPRCYSQYPNLNFKRLGTEKGIKDVRHNSFVRKDSRGFWWISSMSGIYRFDGKYAVRYTVSPNGEFDENIHLALGYSESKCFFNDDKATKSLISNNIL